MNVKLLKSLFFMMYLTAANAANAGLILDFTESSGDTVISVSGSLDLTGITGLNYNENFSYLWRNLSNGGNISDYSQVSIGEDLSETFFFAHGGTANFALFTKAINAGFTTNFLGHSFGIWGENGTASGAISFDTSYISGTQLTGQGTLTGWTLDALGVVNTGVWLTTTNGDDITVTLNGVGATSVPEPSTLAVFVLSIIGLKLSRYKRFKF